MAGMPSVLTELGGAAGRLGGQAAEIVKDRLELLALEMREDKIRVLQLLLLAISGTALTLFGLILLVVAGVYALPTEWRLAGMLVAGAVALVAGLAGLCMLKQRLRSRPGLFAQSIAELEKDRACF
jgi:Predicted membrane protein